MNSTPKASDWARRRKLVGIALLGFPMLCVVIADLARRGGRILTFGPYYQMTYALAALESLILWGLLLYAACRRRGALRNVAAVLFVVFTTFSFGGQQYFFEQYNAYLNVDVSVFASNFWDSVVNQLLADFDNYLKAKAPPFLVAIGLVVAGRRIIRPRRTPAKLAQILAPIATIGSFFIPTQHRHVQAATPDVLYMQAVGGVLRTQLGLTEQSNQLRPRARESLPVKPLKSSAEPARNVLFLILESVRADAVCLDHSQSCKKTPYSDALVPNRVNLRQMRSLASSTAISLAVLWSGLGPHESRERLHTWPLLFDYAHAAGWDTAFWTSQNMMFGNSRLWVKNLGVSKFCSATDLEPTADLDMGAPEQLLAQRVNQEIGQLKEPFLAVVQFSNVHYPYLLDENGPQPFQPATTSKAPEDNAHFFNLYLNSVHQQDRHVASIIERLRSTDTGKRTVIVYTSDHGEAFREHNQMGHTFSVLDEEIHVPGWVDAPPGLLSENALKNLQAKSDAFTFHPDLFATILDVMGVWQSPEISEYRELTLGTSLLDSKTNQRALPLTNCAGVWSCAFENWGYMRGNLKLEARAWDPFWHCYDLLSDPRERDALPERRCGDLKQRALSTFKRLPGKKD